ncbi:hypothetical protein PGIN_ATCC49417_01683 [Porphyromonas gingivalis]|nr:hypothetical protein PGIN_ATCC49417_01683 [Porphyromonas gingivalis]
MKNCVLIDGVYIAIITRCNSDSYKTQTRKNNFHQGIKKWGGRKTSPLLSYFFRLSTYGSIGNFHDVEFDTLRGGIFTGENFFFYIF